MIKNVIKIFGLLVFSFYCLCINASNTEVTNEDQAKVIATVERAENYIEKYGIEKAKVEFRENAQDIFMADYKGVFFVSPLHPELIGVNQFNYRDPSGALVVQEEINKAKAGGGWLKGRWREDPKTGQYVCRKIYILPVPDDYFIGSWYHYPSNKPGTCLI